MRPSVPCISSVPESFSKSKLILTAARASPVRLLAEEVVPLPVPLLTPVPLDVSALPVPRRMPQIRMIPTRLPPDKKNDNEAGSTVQSSRFTVSPRKTGASRKNEPGGPEVSALNEVDGTTSITDPLPLDCANAFDCMKQIAKKTVIALLKLKHCLCPKPNLLVVITYPLLFR